MSNYSSEHLNSQNSIFMGYVVLTLYLRYVCTCRILTKTCVQFLLEISANAVGTFKFLSRSKEKYQEKYKFQSLAWDSNIFCCSYTEEPQNTPHANMKYMNYFGFLKVKPVCERKKYSYLAKVRMKFYMFFAGLVV